MTNYKQLCAELGALAQRQHYYCDDSWYSCPKAIDGCADDFQGTDCNCGADAHNAKVDELLAALAHPEPEGPTDEELLELMPETMRDEFSYAAKTCSDATGGQVKPGIFRVCLNTAALEYARAALARWGTPNSAEVRRSIGEPAECPACEGQPAPSNTPCAVCGKDGHTQQPADAEVAELVKWLRSRAGIPASPDFPAVAAYLTRAADLLERLSPPQPIPVSERLPGPGDCDDEGRCWLLTVEDDYPQWRLHSIQGAQPGGAMIWVPVDSSPGVMVDCFYTSHWLPAHALPVPIDD